MRHFFRCSLNNTTNCYILEDLKVDMIFLQRTFGFHKNIELNFKVRVVAVASIKVAN